MKKLYLLDASGYLYRSYFAIREMTNHKGESTNALFGFIRSVLKLMKEFQPTYLAAVFDGPNNGAARRALYPDYKAHRKKMPDDLLYQVEWAQKFCKLMGIKELKIAGVEADDTMGSLALWAKKMGLETFLCTADKDMCQLVQEQIAVLNPFKENRILRAEEVEAQYGIPPEKMVDFLAMTGDASDNIPGLTGFGPKTAADLLKRHGTLDTLLEHPELVSGKKKQLTLVEEKERVLLSRRLVAIDTAVPFEKDLDSFGKSQADAAALRDFYAYMNFSSLLREFDQTDDRNSRIGEDQNQKVCYTLVDDAASLDCLIAALFEQKQICVDTETTGLDPMRAKLVGIGLGFSAQQAWYIPLNGNLGKSEGLKKLKPLFESDRIAFFGHNIKYDLHVLQSEGITIHTIGFDTILASYLLNSHRRQHSLDALSLELFGKTKIPIEALIGKGKNQISMQEAPVEKVCTYCCEDVDYTIRLKEKLDTQLKERHLTALYEEIELPLLKVLAVMERNGIYVDIECLHRLSKELKVQIEQSAHEVYALAGEPFNLNSPKQLSSILFEKLGIRPPKKTATGLSTSADVLEGLKKDYPIAGKILEYRALEKLRSTYLDTLPYQVNPQTGRIHCTFNQSMAATGRLSCHDPNLQNIPVRTELGKELRAAFRPQRQGWSFLSADYSQIELRLLAHFSEDPVLIQAFLSGEDVHALTAAEIFAIAPSEVTLEQRNLAKTVNFAIMYGQQAFGLSQELGVDPKTAAAFIHSYFERYRKVKEYFEKCKELSRQTGRATTLFGRERLIPEIHSTNAHVRGAAERLAINTPLQGTQADLIKKAMVDIQKALQRAKSRSMMLLQIHDELLFEIPDEETEQMKEIVQKAMTSVVNLKIPLVVNMHIGKNWREC